MIARTHLCILVAVAAAFASQAQAQEQEQEVRIHRDAKQHYEIRIPQSFVLHAAGDLLGSYQGNQPMAMSVSRIDYPSLPAWRKNQRDSFIESVVAGARASAKDYRQKSLKSHRVDRVPALDLHFTRFGKSGQEHVWMRFLFFRRYTLVASASTPSTSQGKHKKRAKDFTRSLAPSRAPAP